MSNQSRYLSADTAAAVHRWWCVFTVKQQHVRSDRPAVCVSESQSSVGPESSLSEDVNYDQQVRSRVKVLVNLRATVFHLHALDHS